MKFGKQLAKYREENNIDQKDIAKLLNIKPQTVSNYETGKNKIPYEKLIMLCNHYKINPLILLKADLDFELGELKTEDQTIINNYKSLTPHDKEIVDHIFNMKTEEPTKIYRFPIFYQSAAASIGRLSETEEYQMKEFQLQSMPSKAVFGMFIKGHSMETTIYEDDIVLIDPSVKVSSNLDDKIVVALFGDELICKRFSVNNDDQTYDFTSDNSSDKDKGRFHQKQSNFTLVGKVVKILHVHDETGKGILRYIED
ncbi:MAG: XRE family transcriptional regulator [Roseburia sp.]|nr:XRE family transcriptional regulator [Roseburia sp.]